MTARARTDRGISPTGLKGNPLEMLIGMTKKRTVSGRNSSLICAVLTLSAAVISLTLAKHCSERSVPRS